LTTGRLCRATRWTAPSRCARWSQHPCRWGGQGPAATAAPLVAACAPC
jgi:hypothetical protein